MKKNVSTQKYEKYIRARAWIYLSEMVQTKQG